MSLTYEIVTKRIDTSKVGKQVIELIEKYKEAYKTTPKKADAVFGRPLIRKLKQQKPEAFTRRANLTAIQKAGRDLRLQKSSRAGEILAKANTAKTRAMNQDIAEYRLRRKGFAGICGYGSNDVML